MCWHRWGNWQDSRIIWEQTDTADGGVHKIPRVVNQQRRCLKCKKVEVRYCY